MRAPEARDRINPKRKSSLMFITALTIRVQSLVQQVWSDESGQDLVEYALIVAAVGLALITTVNQLTQAVVSLYQSMTQGLGSIGTAQ